jgi:hypothetical protein
MDGTRCIDGARCMDGTRRGDTACAVTRPGSVSGAGAGADTGVGVCAEEEGTAPPPGL